MKKSRQITCVVAILLALVLLAGCNRGGDSSSAAAPASAPAAAEGASAAAPAPTGGGNISVTVSNYTDYNFNELYVTPTASTEWGEDHLGSTNILKKNGSFDISLAKYEFNTYDIHIIDEDGDEYLFSRVPLDNGSEVQISFEADGLVATSIMPDGTMEAVYGALSGSEDGGGETNQAAVPENTDTGFDTNGEFTFTVYNESDYDIYAIYIGVSTASAADDIDVLPAILPAHQSTDITAHASSGDWTNTEWTMYIQDVDGDTSASMDAFNPWTLAYVDITWNSDAGGYSCAFYY